MAPPGYKVFFLCEIHTNDAKVFQPSAKILELEVAQYLLTRWISSLCPSPSLVVFQVVCRGPQLICAGIHDRDAGLLPV